VVELKIAVIALGGIVCDKSVKIAGDVFTNDMYITLPNTTFCWRKYC
jgi:actin-like ATPase involved in cell morphogenesis